MPAYHHMITIGELLLDKTINRLENRILLREITGFNEAYLISHDEYQLTHVQYQQYQHWVQRVKTGEPLAYIIGYKEFYSRKFKVTHATLIPRPETELLVEKVIELAPRNSLVLDLGTGSGCIAITTKLERNDLTVTAVDVSTEALAIASLNAKNLGAAVNFIHSNWYQNLTGKFAIITSNPPYIEVADGHLPNLQFEPQLALTDFADGLACINQIITQAPLYLAANGWLILEHGYNQALAVQELLTGGGFNHVTTIKDYAGLNRISYGQI